MKNEPDTVEKSNKEICNFVFKKRAKREKIKNKKKNESSSSSDQESTVIKKKIKNIINPLIKSSSNFKNILDNKTATIDSPFKSTKLKESILPKDMGATAHNEMETEFDKDDQALFQKYIDCREKKGVDEHFDGKYKGLNYYNKFTNPKDSAQAKAASGKSRVGPIRASTVVRNTVRWDYAPCICKDYKETGFCGFGDSCVFMHDRSDYKYGWQLEKEFENSKMEENYEIVQNDKDDLPFACYICRESFNKPIITKCNHYFCEECALKQYIKSKRCFVCSKPTNGVFNPAKDLMKKLAQYRNKESKDADSEPDDFS